jgi:DNA-directed RNA polymerase specialized sigma24 family protein
MGTTAGTDAELIDRAREGDETAFTALYRRHHAAVLRLAATYRRRGEPHDLVDGVFGEVVALLRREARPPEAFRAYLFATVRRLAGRHPEIAPAGVTGEVPGPVAAVAGRLALGGADRAMTSAAFTALADRWQVVVWHTAIDGCDAPALADRLGVSPTAAATLARRAGDKLRQAYLDAHLVGAPRPGCSPHRSRLGAHRRGSLGAAEERATAEHVERCDACRTLLDDLDVLEDRLALSVVPLFPAAHRSPAAIGATAPLAVGVTGQEIALHVPDGEPLPFRSAGPRHLAAGAVRRWGRRLSSGERPAAVAPGRTSRPIVLAGAAAVVALLAGVAVAGTALTDDSTRSSDVEIAADLDPPSRVTGRRSSDEATATTGEAPTTATGPTTAATDGPGSTGGVSRSRSRPSSTSTSLWPSSTSTSLWPGSTPTSLWPGSTSTSAGTVPPTSTATTQPPATTGPPAPTTPPATDPPTTEPPGTTLLLATPAWSPSGPGTGTLTVAIDQPVPFGAEIGPQLHPPDATDVIVTIDVTDGVTLLGRLDDRCRSQTGTGGGFTGVRCALAAPASGGRTAVWIDLAVAGPGRQATVHAQHGSSDLGSATVDLVASVEGDVPLATTPPDSTTSSVPFPTG